MVIAFGIGLWLTPGRKRSLRIVAIVLICDAILQFVAVAFGSYFSMNMRGAEKTFSDSIHIILGMVDILSMLLCVGFGSKVFGKRFRLYSVVTILIIIGGAILTTVNGIRLGANLPTPWLGIEERVFVYSFMVWVMALAISMLLQDKKQGTNKALSSND